MNRAHGKPALAELGRGTRFLGGGALMVQGEKVGEDLFAGEAGGPAVGGEDGFVEGAVGVGEPIGPFVVEVGEGAGSQANNLYLETREVRMYLVSGLRACRRSPLGRP